VHIDVAAIIREILSDRQVVSITGLGSLRLVHQSASFSEKGKALKPPSMELVFSESTGTNTSLTKRISDNYKITNEQAGQVLKKFNKKILTLLVNYNKVSIPGVALIEKSKKDKIKVTPSLAYVDAYYKGLPKISVTPILSSTDKVLKDNPSTRKEIKKTIISSVSELKNSPSSKISDAQSNGKSDYSAKEKTYVPPPVIPSQGKATMTKEPQAKTSIKSEPTPAAATTFSSEKQQRPLYSASAEKRRDFLWPIIMLVAFLLLMLLGIKACNSIMNMNSNKSGLELIDSETEIIDEIVANDSMSSYDIEKMTNDGSLIPASGQCKIVTGVYSKLSNVVNMKEKVRDAGYEVYTEEFGTYTRVGLVYNCDEETDLEAYLQGIRRELNPRAWYLDPSLYVEYINY